MRDNSDAIILVTRKLPEPVEERMRQLFNVRLNLDDQPLTRADFLHQVQDAKVIVSTITDQIDAELVAQLPESVKLIAQFGNGVDNIDVAAAHERGIGVTNTPSVMSEDTADMALALIMALPRRIVEASSLLTQSGQWTGWSPTAMLGRRLAGKSLGIVGLGRIGAAVARRARAFGLNIHYSARSQRPEVLENELSAQYWPDLGQMLAAVDIVSLHLPLTQNTHHLLDQDMLKRMKPDAYLVNVSRSELVDERALIAQIKDGHLGGAGLDVFSHRQGIDPELLALANDHRVVLTPHVASSTLEGRIEMGETVIVNIKIFLDGHQPPQRVLPDRAQI